MSTEVWPGEEAYAYAPVGKLGETYWHPVACPCASKGEQCLAFAPREWVEVRKFAAVRGEEDTVRCFLLRAPSPCVGVDTAVLKQWRREMERFVPDGVRIGVYEAGAPYPCGYRPLCRVEGEAEREDFNLAVAQLEQCDRTFAAAVERFLPQLSPRVREIFHVWAVRSSPRDGRNVISAAEVGAAFGLTERTVQRTLKKVSKAAPALYARALAQRQQRAHITRAYEVAMT